MRLTLDITVHRYTLYAEAHAVIDRVFEADDTRHTDFQSRIKVVDVTADAMVLQASAWYPPDAFWVARGTLPRALIDHLTAAGIKDVIVEPRRNTPKKLTKEAVAEPANDDLF